MENTITLEPGMTVQYKRGFEIDGNVEWVPCSVERVTNTMAIVGGHRFRRTVVIDQTGYGHLSLVKPRMWGPVYRIHVPELAPTTKS